jgi:quercetin dioxygenase-like cupin family protein
MRPLNTYPFAVFALSTASAFLIIGCSSLSGSISQHAPSAVTPAQTQALILQESDGERRLHRPPPGALSNLTALFTLKVDHRNGGAPEFVMLTEDIPSGQAISPHRHPHSDEILFIYGGTGLASLAGHEASVAAGATIYMPRNTVVGLRNTGTEPLRIVAIFSQPGYEEYLREISVPEGEPPTPLTIEELSAIRAHHLDSAVYEQP